MSDPAAMTLRSWALGCRDIAAAGRDGAFAKETAKIMRDKIVEAINEQRSVDGTPFQPRADGSGRPVLVNAAKAIEVDGVGTMAIVTLSGPEVFHHYGAGRNPERRILPTGGVGKLGLAIALGIVEMCSGFMTRKGRHDKGGGNAWKGGKK